MGLIKKLKRGAKRVAKFAVKTALTNVPGGGIVGDIALSKIKGMGKSRRKDEQMQKIAGSLPPKDSVQYAKLAGSSNRPRPQAATKLAIKGPAAKAAFDEVLNPIQAGRNRFAKQKADRDSVNKRAAKLSKDDWEALKKEYVDLGKPGSWEDFVKARI